MSHNKLNLAWQSDSGGNESSNLEQVDAFVLNPGSSHDLVQRLYADPAWKITCQTPNLVIFVRSGSEFIDGRKEKSLRGAGRDMRGGESGEYAPTYASPLVVSSISVVS